RERRRDRGQRRDPRRGGGRRPRPRGGHGARVGPLSRRLVPAPDFCGAPAPTTANKCLTTPWYVALSVRTIVWDPGPIQIVLPKWNRNRAPGLAGQGTTNKEWRVMRTISADRPSDTMRADRSSVRPLARLAGLFRRRSAPTYRMAPPLRNPHYIGLHIAAA